MTTPVLDRLADVVRAEGGLLMAAVREPEAIATPYSDALALAPRAQSSQADLALVLETVREGYLLHHGKARVLADDDRDLALLAGDRLYAAGLELLAAVGDGASVRALADVIALAAGAHARSDAELADAVWEAGMAEIGWGSSTALQDAKTTAIEDPERAAAALRAAAREARREPGLVR
ncbi:MAG TPA: hypothetical protein VNT22_09020 [Baekduia sp.]|nr:hypothetical protein [Baekduia sp.]